MFYNAIATPWCHTGADFELKKSRFGGFTMMLLTVEACLQSKRSFFQGDVQCRCKIRTQLGPPLSLEYQDGFTLTRLYTPS